MGLTGFNRRRREIAALLAKENVSPVSEKKQEPVETKPVETKEEPKVEEKVEEPKTEVKAEPKAESVKKASKK